MKIILLTLTLVLAACTPPYVEDPWTSHKGEEFKHPTCEKAREKNPEVDC